MKKNCLFNLRTLALAMCAMLAFALVCGIARPVYASGDDTATAPDEVGETVGNALEDAGETVGNALEDAGEAVDEALTEAGDAIGAITGTAAEDGEADDSAEDANEGRIKLYTIVAAALALIVVLVVYFVFRSKTARFSTKQLVESALMIAIATILSLIKIDSPYGGGVTIVSMLPIVLISHRWGWGWGLVTAFVYSLIQLMLGLDNVAYATSFMMAVGIILLDYVVAYSVIGLSGVFGKSRAAVATGIVVTFTLRFLCHWVTGGIIWDVWMPEEFWGLPMTNPWVYSAMYNGWYMAIELVATLLVAMLIYKPLEKYIRNEA